MCKGSKARQHGQSEEASHGKFLHILQVSTQTCPFSLWSCSQLFQGDLHPLLFPEDLQCLFLADSLHYIVIYLDCNILYLSFLLKTIRSLEAGNYAWFCFLTATSKQWYYPFISPNERGFFPLITGRRLECCPSYSGTPDSNLQPTDSVLHAQFPLDLPIFPILLFTALYHLYLSISSSGWKSLESKDQGGLIPWLLSA